MQIVLDENGEEIVPDAEQNQMGKSNNKKRPNDGSSIETEDRRCQESIEGARSKEPETKSITS